MDDLFREFSEAAKQAFEDEGFQPETVLEIMNKFELEAERSLAALDAAHEKEFRAAEAELNATEAYLDSILGKEMVLFENIPDFAAEAQAELDKLSNFAKAAHKMTDKLSAAAAIAAKQYFESSLMAATAAFALKSADKAMRSKFFRISW